MNDIVWKLIIPFQDIVYTILLSMINPMMSMHLVLTTLQCEMNEYKEVIKWN